MINATLHHVCMYVRSDRTRGQWPDVCHAGLSGPVHSCVNVTASAFRFLNKTPIKIARKIIVNLASNFD